MKRVQLDVTIKPDGETVVDVVEGPGGRGCLDLIAAVTAGLGEADVEDKAEMFETEELAEYVEEGS